MIENKTCKAYFHPNNYLYLIAFLILMYKRGAEMGTFMMYIPMDFVRFSCVTFPHSLMNNKFSDD